MSETKIISKTVHLVLDVQGAINWPAHLLRGLFQTSGGKAVSAKDARAYLTEQLAKGIHVMPIGKACEGFDPVTGCPGHPVTEEEV